MRRYGITNAAPYAAAPAVGASGDMYWNTATKLLYVSDGAAWIPAGYWTVSGNNLIPVDGTKGLAVPATGNLTCLTLGGRTVKARVITDTANNNVRITINDTLTTAPGWTQDDVSMPSWGNSLFGDVATDALDISRSAPGGAFLSTIAQLTKAGDLNVSSTEGTLRAVTGMPFAAGYASGGASSNSPFNLCTFPSFTTRGSRLIRVVGGGLFALVAGQTLYIILAGGAFPTGPTIAQLAYTAPGSNVNGIWNMDLRIVPWSSQQLLVQGLIQASGSRAGGSTAEAITANGIVGYQPTVASMPILAPTIGGVFITANAANILDLRGGFMQII